jgi:hypothetical protein
LIVVIVRIKEPRQLQLFLVANTLGQARGHLCRTKRRQKQTRQNTDHRNNNEEFDQTERAWKPP